MLVAAIFATGITSSSLAMAQTIPSEKHLFENSFEAPMSAGYQAGILVSNDTPDIEGTIDVGNNILDSAKTSLSKAITTAESQTDGKAIRANLGIQNGFLVYTVTVLSDDGTRVIVIDAGNGKTLHKSDPFPTDAVSLLNSGNHKMIFKSSPNMVVKGIISDQLTENK